MARLNAMEIDGGGADLGTINVTPDTTPKASTTQPTREERMAQLKAEREGRTIAAAEARAASNPMLDPTNRPEAPAADENYIYYYSWIGGTTTGQWKLYRAPKTDVNQATYGSRAVGGETQASFSSTTGANSLINQPKPIKDSDGNITGWTKTGDGTNVTGTGVTGTGVTGTGVTGTGVTGTGVTGTGVTGTGVTGTGVTGTGKTGPTLAKDVFKQTLAMFFGQADASKPWMDELYNAVSKFYLSGASVDEALNMALLDSRNNPNLKEFTDRFKGIYGLMDMKQAGKPVTIPTIAEYVSSQAKMADILTQANLADYATTEYTGELIGKGNSVSTIADKIANVFNRIDFAPKEIKDTFSRYFPTADRLKLAGALLQGEKGVTQLVDELAQYEVLAAAEAQGLGALGARAKVGGVTAERAQQYARAGGTYQSLLPKFGQIARALPDVQKLTGISRVADISQADVEKAVISQSEQELRRLEDISLQEEARFRAKAGRADIPLASQRRANRAY